MPRLHSVEIIAHRGASRDRLENTLSAFRAALDQGADGIELDVHATRDGVVVVHHDAVVRRGDAAGSRGGSKGTGALDSAGSSGTGTLDSAGSSGTGTLDFPQANERLSFDATGSSVPVPFESSRSSVPVPLDPPLDPVPISSLTYDELRTLTLANGEPIPTLDEVLSLATGKTTVYVEVKGASIEQHVVDCLARHPNTATAVHSFDHRIPHTIGKLDQRVPLGILSSSYVLDLAHMIRTAGARDLWQHTALVDQSLVDTAHAAGARVVVWTENSFGHAIQLVQMGVDAICTDIPGPMRQALSDAGLITPNRGE